MSVVFVVSVPMAGRRLVPSCCFRCTCACHCVSVLRLAAASGVSFARYGYRCRFRALQKVDRRGPQGVHGLEEVEEFLGEVDRVKKWSLGKRMESTCGFHAQGRC